MSDVSISSPQGNPCCWHNVKKEIKHKCVFSLRLGGGDVCMEVQYTEKKRVPVAVCSAVVACPLAAPWRALQCVCVSVCVSMPREHDRVLNVCPSNWKVPKGKFLLPTKGTWKKNSS